MGGLKHVRDLVLEFFSFYSLSVALAILSTINPFNNINYGTLIFIIILIIGTVFFITNMNKINKVLRECVDIKFKKIDRLYALHHRRLIRIISGTSKAHLAESKDELDWLSKAIQSLMNERTLLIQVNTGIYNLKSFMVYILSKLFCTFQLFDNFIIYSTYNWLKSSY
jgi:hypothetical protein